jgi:hypothetical protein
MIILYYQPSTVDITEAIVNLNYFIYGFFLKNHCLLLIIIDFNFNVKMYLLQMNLYCCAKSYYLNFPKNQIIFYK